MSKSVKRTAKRSLPLRTEPEPKVHLPPYKRPTVDVLDDMNAELHVVLSLLSILERGTGAIPTGTFIDGTFTGGELHALSVAAGNHLRTILGHAPVCLM
jgi:hypothetical protein